MYSVVVSIYFCNRCLTVKTGTIRLISEHSSLRFHSLSVRDGENIAASVLHIHTNLFSKYKMNAKRSTITGKPLLYRWQIRKVIKIEQAILNAAR